MAKTSKRIFLSHAVKDKPLAEALVDLLETGIGIPSDDVFCSSLEGMGIPAGENFIHYINGEIQEPDIVILLLTSNYYESKFCLCELGASWAMSHDICPIIVPPLKYENVKEVLTSIQLVDISDETKLSEMREKLVGALKIKGKSFPIWEAKRNKFLKQLPAILTKLPKQTIVSLADHLEIKSKYEEAVSEIENYDNENEKLKEQIEELKKCKDKEDVIKVEKDFSDTTSLDEFNAIIDEITKIKSIISGEVLKFILCDHYNLPYRIDLFNYREEFNDAERRRLIDTEDEDVALWSNRHLNKLQSALSALSYFISEHEEDTSFMSLYDEKFESDFDPENQEFWEEHYCI